METLMQHPHRVVIVGGGFAGLHAAQSLKNAAVRVTLIDRRNFHLFQPLLYQVATGAVSPANIASPLRQILRDQRNAEVIMAEVADFDTVNKKVILTDGVVDYDTLIVAAGATHSYFGNDQWQHLAPGLKTIEDATEIRQRLLLAFEAAERATDPEEVQAWLNFVIVGAGPTGVELAGALAEIARVTLKGNFRRINPATARIFLVEGTDRVLPPYPSQLSAKAAESLAKLGVTVRTGAMVADIQPEYVTLKSGDTLERIPTHTVVWAAGVKASSLGKSLVAATGAKEDRAGRVMVEADMSIAGHPNIFVVGDLAHYAHVGGKPLPGIAPVAMQQGQYVGHVIKRRILGQVPKAFSYIDYGNMATIGRATAVADIKGLRFSGFMAWMFWLVVHLIKLVGYQNRMLVLMQWAWNYLTFNRSARLITGSAGKAPTRFKLDAARKEVESAKA